MRKVFKALVAGAFVLLMVWVCASWMDIVEDNCYPNPEHSENNFFSVAFAEKENVSNFDTSALETWCGQANGNVRMVGAWRYDATSYEDETGSIWEVEGESVREGFYLLWIDDMGTNDLKDDEIVKVWSEVA